MIKDEFQLLTKVEKKQLGMIMFEYETVLENTCVKAN